MMQMCLRMGILDGEISDITDCWYTRVLNGGAPQDDWDSRSGVFFKMSYTFWGQKV